MAENSTRDISSSPYPAAGPRHEVPLWIPILMVVILFVLPASVYAGYCIYMRRKGDVNQTESPTPVKVDLEKQSSETRSSTGKWSLSVPGRNTQANTTRRGSDGGFPPGTRHITFPDPTFSASVDSFDRKPPPISGATASVVSPLTLQYPTPPRAVFTHTGERRYI